MESGPLHTELPWAPDLDLGPDPSLSQDPGAAALHDLRFFGAVLRRAACLRRCLGPPSAHLLSEELDLEFNKRSPYNYLQVAYFKINKLEKAVAAAHTFFVGNPEHMEMRQNLDYYQTMSGVKEADFRDLEAKPHMIITSRSSTVSRTVSRSWLPTQVGKSPLKTSSLHTIITYSLPTTTLGTIHKLLNVPRPTSSSFPMMR